MGVQLTLVISGGAHLVNHADASPVRACLALHLMYRQLTTLGGSIDKPREGVTSPYPASSEQGLVRSQSFGSRPPHSDGVLCFVHIISLLIPLHGCWLTQISLIADIDNPLWRKRSPLGPVCPKILPLPPPSRVETMTLFPSRGLSDVFNFNIIVVRARYRIGSSVPRGGLILTIFSDRFSFPVRM